MLELTPGDGCGNRFLLVQEHAMLAAGESGPDLAQRLCGESYDGLLVLGVEVDGALPVTIVNRDGSDGGACLNGLRVAACFSGQERGRLLMAGEVVDWKRCDSGFELELPLRADEMKIREHVEAGPDGSAGDSVGGPGDASSAADQPWFQVEFWNPHAVFRSKPTGQCLADFAASVAARVDLFPQGVNVEVVPELGQSDELSMRVFERGVGETAACGSGALAVAAVAWKLGAGPCVGIQMKGGRLEVEQAESRRIRLRGAAKVGPPQSLQELLRSVPKMRS